MAGCDSIAWLRPGGVRVGGDRSGNPGESTMNQKTNAGSSPMPGGCLCGSVRYQVVAEPTMLYACHCTDCQTFSGAGFALCMRIPDNGIEVAKGDPVLHRTSWPSGRVENTYRCPECLTALWDAREGSNGSAGYLSLYTGTLDDTSNLRPVGHVWTSDAQPWIVIPEGDLVYEHGPSDMGLFEEAWKTRSGRQSLGPSIA